MLRRHCAEPRVMVGSLRRKAKPRRQSQTALSPTYSLGSSRSRSLSHNRTMLRKAPTRNGRTPARVSSGPTGMYTEHIAWARTLTNQPSSKDSSKPEPVPILPYAE